MPAKLYKVTLTLEERDFLSNVASKGQGAAQKITHARILLKADQGENGPGWEDQLISKTLDVSVTMIERIRKTFIEQGLDAALNRKKPCRIRSVKFDGEKEAYLVALACSQPPDGRQSWTLRLLADKMVELNHFAELSYETVRQVLKKRTQALVKETVVYSAGSQC